MSRTAPKLVSGHTLREGIRRPTADHPDRGSENPTIGTITPAVVVLGAAGVAGQGIVRAAIAAGEPVVAIGAESARLAVLRPVHRVADLVVLEAPITDDADARRLATGLRNLGRPVSGVVDAMSTGTGRGRLLDHPVELIRQRIDEELTPHLAAARHLIPLLAETRRGGTYLFIGGPCGASPWSGYGYRSIGAAALRMLARVLNHEASSLDVRVQMLEVDAPVRGDPGDRHACPEWPTADALGRHALDLIGQRITAESARAVVRHPGDVDPTAAPATTNVIGVRSFLRSLSALGRSEEFPDDIP